MKQNKFVIIILYIIIFGFVSFMALITYPNWLPRKDFNSEAWKKGNLTERNRMIDDLLDRKIILGKSSEQVRSILGSPDGVYNTWMWYYNANLGAGASGSGIDVYFDQSADTVNNVHIQ